MRVVSLPCPGTHGEGWGSPLTLQGQSLRSPSNPRALMLSYTMQVLERLQDGATRRQCNFKCSPPPGSPECYEGETTAAGETDQAGTPAPSSRGWG